MLKFIPELVEDQQFKITKNQVDEILDEPVRRILAIIQGAGFEIRIVGGAVRDLLMGLTPNDVDLATNASPDQVMYLLKADDIDVHVWGISHGSLAVFINKVKYDITSLDYSIRMTKKGKPIVKSKKDWISDAKRRDFSMNALSMDLDGNIYDYVGGLDDIKNQIIRGLPDVAKKIHTDPNNILRAFKMMAKLEKPKITKSTMEAIKNNVGLVANVSKDRVREILREIIQRPNALLTLKKMKEWGVLNVLGLREDNLDQVADIFRQTGDVKLAWKALRWGTKK